MPLANQGIVDTDRSEEKRRRMTRQVTPEELIQELNKIGVLTRLSTVRVLTRGCECQNPRDAAAIGLYDVG